MALMLVAIRLYVAVSMSRQFTMTKQYCILQRIYDYDKMLFELSVRFYYRDNV